MSIPLVKGTGGHFAVQTTGVVNRLLVAPSTPAVPHRLSKAFRTIGNGLWPAIVHTQTGGNTYARCILTSLAIREFLRGRGFEAEVESVILDVSRRRGDVLDFPITMGIGQPDKALGLNGIHVVAVVQLDDRKWIIDGSVRQTYREGRWIMPPEVVVAEVSSALSSITIDEDYVQLGFSPMARCDLPQGDDSSLRLLWLGKQGYQSPWQGSPDADPDRAAKISKRLNAAWQRS